MKTPQSVLPYLLAILYVQSWCSKFLEWSCLTKISRSDRPAPLYSLTHVWIINAELCISKYTCTWNYLTWIEGIRNMYLMHDRQQFPWNQKEMQTAGHSSSQQRLKVKGVICYFSKCKKTKVVIKISFPLGFLTTKTRILMT